MTNVFMKSIVLIIIFFCNQTIFGMMLSTNNSWKKQWQINNKLRLLIFSNDIILNEIYNKFCFNDSLTLRLVYKKFAQCDSILPQLVATYKNEKKQVSPVCAFFDCVDKKEHEKVKWFLKNKLDEPLFFVTLSNRYDILDPFVLAQKNEDTQMMQLLDKYKTNIYAEIQNIQKNIDREGWMIKILSNNRTTDNRTEKIKNLLKKEKIFIEDDKNNDYKWFTDSTLIQQNINYSLCLAACCGDIDAFELELTKCTTHLHRYDNVPLVTWIAIKNYDINFIFNLLNHNAFTNYLKNSKIMHSLFIYIVANTSIENVATTSIEYPRLCPPVSKNISLSKSRVDWIKKLIENDIFIIESDFFEKYKTLGDRFNEIYEALKSQTIERQKNQIKQSTHNCSIQ